MKKRSLLMAALCAATLMAAGVQMASAYSVRLTYLHASTGQMDMQRTGYCAESDPASHTFMPATEGFNNQAKTTLKNGGGTQAPIGGYARKSICLDTTCAWEYYKGLYDMNQVTFYRGVYYSGTAKVAAVDGFYTNWASGYPIAWDNISYWGLRQPVMLSSGQWQNVDVVTYFTDWVCEYYEYHKSDHVFFPTWVNGDPITPTPAGASHFSHCGKKIYYDSQHRLADVHCPVSFPWWAGLIIAIGCFVIVVVLMLVIWCCCCLTGQDEEEEAARAEKLRTFEDNPGHIPSQSDLGRSSRSSSRSLLEYEEEEEDERSFARTDSYV